MPFTSEQFFAVFRAYNESVWPAQWFLFAAGLLVVAGVILRRNWSARLSFLLLGSLWLWMALAYHLAHFARINPAAPGFAALFMVGAAFFVWRALSPRPLCLEVGKDLAGVSGTLLVIYGLLLYPLVGLSFGHRFPTAPSFGLPCPTTIFTIGILSFIRPIPERYLLTVPIIWAIIGSIGTITLGVPQDYGLTVAGLWAAALAVWRPQEALRTEDQRGRAAAGIVRQTS